MRRFATALVAIVAVVLGGCGAGDVTGPPDDGNGSAQDGSDADAQEPDANGGGTADNGTADNGTADGDENGAGETGDGGEPGAGPGEPAPELIGIGLAAARDQAEAAGFDPEVHDATGRTRTQVLETNWRVCFQQPEPGATADGLHLGVVKLEEDCPEADQGAAPPELGAENELPDFSGHSLAAATDVLGSSASVLPVDATDADRNIFHERNWRICAQDPGPGTRWEGAQITFQVVQYDEDCPG